MEHMQFAYGPMKNRHLEDFDAKRHIGADGERLYHSLTNFEPYEENLFREHNVKRGLRNADGSGVVAGLTRICDVHGYKKIDGVAVPDEGKLTYRGYDVKDLVRNAQSEDRFGYEEVAYLLITGFLPTKGELYDFRQRIADFRFLDREYVYEFPMPTQSTSIMNVLQRAVLMLYAFDANPDTTDPEHEIDVAASLIARLPRIAAIAHMTHLAEMEGREAHIPSPVPSYSVAETVLQVLRGGDDFTRDEAMTLDVMLMLHAEHGGGNNSTFACRVLSSSATDAYSAYAAAIGSLKGPRHGGANAKVTAMQKDIMTHVEHWDNDDELACYLEKIARKDAFDRTGLIYGMGHAVYTLSDPRAQICKRYASRLASIKGLEQEYNLINAIERLAPEVIANVRGTKKPICANIDMYTGLVYHMLGVPQDLYTPLFAVSRMAGWAAHRMEELYGVNRIIRPAYVTVMEDKPYVPIADRSEA